MSWIIEAIEQAALKRARDLMDVRDMRVCGLTFPQIMALRSFFCDKTGCVPEDFTPAQIYQKLHDWTVRTPK